MNGNQNAFIALVRAGLWEKDVQLQPFGKVDYEEVMRLAEEQSVVGLVTAGLEHVTDVKVPQVWLLQFIGQTIQIEEQNKAMNVFIGDLIDRMRNVGIYMLLVKGQGIAQCYERPLWRSNGDVDLLLSEDNYQNAKDFLTPMASHVDPEDKRILHQGMTIDSWVVELHGTMFTDFSGRVNRGVEDAQRAIFNGGEVRSEEFNSSSGSKVQVFIPSPDNDVILVFTHILNHFFIEGVGLRQICDWCRLLWCYRTELNLRLLESRIKRMGLMTEWKAFGSLAVDFLGMAENAMPFYDSRFKVKGERILKRVLKSGNFGHNNDLSYRSKYTGMKYKVVATWRRLRDFASFIPIFPVDAPKFFFTYVFGKVK